MKNYIMINGQKIELTEEQAEKLRSEFAKEVKLGDVPAGETVRIGEHEMIVLEHVAGATKLLRREFLKKMAFGENNNYDGSDADKVCNDFAVEICKIVGEDNVILHEVDLTADDGLKDYGTVKRFASLRTAQMQRQYVYLLDKYRPDAWEWLATAYSTPTHDDDNWVKCVSPAGNVYYLGSYYNVYGVRPFCILKSHIFVSR